ncbi:ABC transporter substrate-binding protein [Cellulosilyticum sp. ST5]|uniref:Extracellular ligand-binding receptor n=1 Tax=Cellulosilyticum lentocellum (strain ATCC 49066 / DSM 5427 / NCIMB 11756 / RHM5) TaxID=642492 RepID=F2JQQ2_CELLD|nr:MULTISPECIES: ABC transporter substrate-binding protein [Cellulosilyticum]ADZ82647.1 Extracellular ligand-binding receptor [Cellulosilyticum lentocellum DSM 5427]QEH68268.1 ABC transporter substrate-binding protein [Cellulosilyticum sp. WCF-2]
MKKSFKASLAILAATMCAASLVGCGDKATSGDVYKIGGIGPLTGDASSYGISVKQGSQVAIDEINAAGGVNGKKLELVFEDDVNDAEKAVSAYNKIMDQGVTALVGAVTSGCSIAVSDESVKDGILQITPSGSAQECTKQPNSFRICFTDPLQGQTMAKYIADNGYKNVAIIYDVASDYSKGIKEAFVAEAGNVGLNIAAEESFTSGDIDFKTQLTKIKGTNADCIFLPIYYAEVAAISEQATTVGVSLPYFGADGWDGVIDQLGGDTTNINGAIFLTPFVATADKENVKSFVAAYEKAYNATPDQFAADGYDAVYAIKAAIEACGSDVTNENLVAAMTKIEVKGVTGDMTFTAEGEPNKSALVAMIQDGQYVAK